MPRSIEDIEFSVSSTVSADPHVTWVAISDTARLRETLSVMSDFEHVSAGRPMTDGGTVADAGAMSAPTQQAIAAGETYTATLSAPVERLPMSFDTYCTVEDHCFPCMVATVGGDGAMGSFDARAVLTVADHPEGTEIEWSARAGVAGPLAGLGESAIQGLVTYIVEDYLDRLDASLA
ncbi:SRPBCC family protein [Haloarchaeobius sp. DFWS5]|uniref:SRPBCC family protein n=1 Tax=Haloarchaeobius sp. DFWS5 TaxID=3446114 RepID=UPI003EB767C6